MQDHELTQRFDRIDGRFERIDQRFDSLEGLVREVMARVEAGFQHLHARIADTRIHIDVVAESLRDDIRLVAEGYDALRSDMTDVKAGQASLEQKFERLELRQLALEQRVS